MKKLIAILCGFALATATFARESHAYLVHFLGAASPCHGFRKWQQFGNSMRFGHVKFKFQLGILGVLSVLNLTPNLL